VQECRTPLEDYRSKQPVTEEEDATDENDESGSGKAFESSDEGGGTAVQGSLGTGTSANGTFVCGSEEVDEIQGLDVSNLKLL